MSKKIPFWIFYLPIYGSNPEKKWITYYLCQFALLQHSVLEENSHGASDFFVFWRNHGASDSNSFCAAQEKAKIVNELEKQKQASTRLVNELEKLKPAKESLPEVGNELSTFILHQCYFFRDEASMSWKYDCPFIC